MHERDEAGGTSILVLGTCAVRAAARMGGSGESGDVGERVELSPVQRKVLARLALARPEPIDVDDLAEAIWGDDPPTTARTAVHNQISRIRSRLGSDAVITASGRYQLTLPTDLDQVADLLDRAEAAMSAGDLTVAVTSCDDALACWRGAPFDDLGELAEVQAARRHVNEIRRSLENLRLDCAIRTGRSSWAIPEAERMVAAAPHDEDRWVLLMQALEHAGRRGDALGAYERARRSLAGELGLEPGPALRAAESAVLSSGSSTRSSGPVRLIGRVDLIDRLIDLVEDGDTVLLIGESGVGKTRILDELARRLRRNEMTVGRSGFAPHADTAISSLAELVESLGGVIDGALPPGAAFVDAVSRRVAVDRSVALVVDDLDDAGPTSSAALVHASRVDGVALIATASEVHLLPAELADVTTIVIPPLDDDDVSALAEVLIGDELAPGDPARDWLIAMSGGNPLLLECLLADPAWGEGRVAPGSDDSDPSAPSAPSGALRDLVRQRLERLGATTRTALEIGAVCGPRCPSEVLLELAPAQGIAGAVAASLLYEEHDDEGRGRMSFRHGAVQRTVYADLPPGRRMEIHHRAAGLLHAAGAAAPVVATHAIAAADVDPYSAAARAIDAAQDASFRAAHADAAAWFDHAIHAASLATAGERLAVTAMIGRGDALRLAGSPDQEDALFAAAEASVALGDPELVGDAAFAVLQLGATTESGSLHGRAIALADLALTIVTDPDQRALIAAAASLTHSMTGNAELCRDLFVQAEAAATSDSIRRHVLPFAYLALGHPTDLEQRERLTEELLTLSSRGVDDPVARFEGLHMAFSVALQRGDGDRVRSSVEESAALMQRVGDVGRRWSLAYQRAAIAHLDNDLDAAEAHATDALELFSSVSPSRAFATYGGQLLPIRMAQGRLDELTDSLRGLVEDQPGVPAWHAALALSLVDTDPVEAARQSASALEQAALDFTWLAGHVIGGRAAARVGDEPLRAEYRARLLPWSGLVCWQGTCAYGPVDTVLAMLAEASGDQTEARMFAKSARELARSLAAPVFELELDQFS